MKSVFTVFVLVITAWLGLSACAGARGPVPGAPLTPPADLAAWVPSEAPADPPWWNRRVFYEIYVRAFQDSDGDRFGDFRGLQSRLGYLKDLGVGGVWLMPIQENKRSDLHGYHVQDYRKVEEDYGTLDDFKALLAAARQQDLKIVIDHVINHTSNEHPWFQSALRGPGSPYRDWYVWSPQRLHEAGPWGQQVWHSPDNGRTWYYGVFNFLIPDLNFRNPAVTAEILDMSRWWLTEVGVDGFRIDASRHLIEEGDELMDAPATYEWFRQHFYPTLKAARPDAYFIGEEFGEPDRPERRIAGNGVDMSFDPEIRGGIIRALQDRRAEPLIRELVRVRQQYPLNQVGTMLGNHDFLRIQSHFDSFFGDLDTGARAMRAAAALLLTGPGVPYIYYGEELGLLGQGNDDNKRRAMQWDDTPGNLGFTSAARPFGAGFNQGGTERTVAAQNADPASLLNWYKRLIALRTGRPSLAWGDLRVLQTNQPGVLAYLRDTADEWTLVVQDVGLQGVDGVEIGLWSGPWAPGQTLSLRPLLGAPADESAGFSLRATDTGGWGVIRWPALGPGETALFEVRPAP